MGDRSRDENPRPGSPRHHDGQVVDRDGRCSLRQPGALFHRCPAPHSGHAARAPGSEAGGAARFSFGWLRAHRSSSSALPQRTTSSSAAPSQRTSPFAWQGRSDRAVSRSSTGRPSRTCSRRRRPVGRPAAGPPGAKLECGVAIGDASFTTGRRERARREVATRARCSASGRDASKGGSRGPHGSGGGGREAANTRRDSRCAGAPGPSRRASHGST